MTYEWCDGGAVRGTAVEVLAACDTGEAGDSVDESWLMWPAVHSGRVGDLKGPFKSMIVRDKLGSLGGLLAVWRQENFRLR